MPLQFHCSSYVTEAIDSLRTEGRCLDVELLCFPAESSAVNSVAKISNQRLRAVCPHSALLLAPLVHGGSWRRHIVSSIYLNKVSTCAPYDTNFVTKGWALEEQLVHTVSRRIAVSAGKLRRYVQLHTTYNITMRKNCVRLIHITDQLPL